MLAAPVFSVTAIAQNRGETREQRVQRENHERMLAANRYRQANNQKRLWERLTPQQQRQQREACGGSLGGNQIDCTASPLNSVGRGPGRH